MKNFNTRRIAALGTLTALCVALQVMSNYITFGPVSITLALIPVVIGAILYGVKGGAFLGAVVGIVVLLSPSTSGFLAFNPVMTIILCLVKTSLAGAVSALLFKAINKKKTLPAVVVSSLIVPIINTGLFAIGVLLFFLPLFGEGIEAVKYLFLTVIGINFIVEFLVNALLASTIYYLIKLIAKKFNIPLTLN